MAGLLDNPYIAMGLGILGSSGPGTNAAQAIGGGGLLGLRAHEEAKARREAREAEKAYKDAMSAYYAAKSEAEMMKAKQAVDAAAARMKTVVALYPGMGGLLGNPEPGAPTAMPASPTAMPTTGGGMAPYQETGVTQWDAGQQQGMPSQGMPSPEEVLGLMSWTQSGNASDIPKQTGNVKDYLFGLKNPDFARSQMALQRAGAGGVSIKQEQEYDKVIGGEYAKHYITIRKSAQTSESKVRKLQEIDRLLNETYTGAGGKGVLQLKKVGRLLGMDLEGIGPAEAAQAIHAEMTLQARDTSEGAGMPGAMSDADREFLASINPGLAMTAEGRKKLIEVQTRLARRNKEVYQLARLYVKQNGRLDENFDNMLADAFADEDLFGDLETGSSPPPPPKGFTQRVE